MAVAIGIDRYIGDDIRKSCIHAYPDYGYPTAVGEYLAGLSVGYGSEGRA